jgi:hypothetical protein
VLRPSLVPRRRLRSFIGLAVVLTLLCLAAASSIAATGPRPLAVSVPADPVVLGPGTTSTIRIRVLNPGTQAVTVRINGRHVDLGDNGAVSIGTTPDPLWNGRVQFPGGTLTIPAQKFVNVDLTVHMPEQLDPDLYFVGFLVSPVVTPNGQVQVVNEIGSFFTVDVPGARLRKLDADLQVNPSVLAHIRLPSIVIGSRAHGVLHVRNIGRTQVRFWGEVDSSSSPGGGVAQDRIDKSLIPRAHVRTFTVVGKPVWPIDFVRLTARIFYPGQTETSTQEIDLSKRVLVISPWVLVAAIVLLAAAVWYWRRRRKRRQPPSGTVRKKPLPVSPGTPAERGSFGFRRRRKAPAENPERVSEPVSGR